MRGQAFIIFRNLKDAANAKNGLSGTILYHKELVLIFPVPPPKFLQKIRFAKQKSDIVAQLEGNHTKIARPQYDCVPVKRKERPADPTVISNNQAQIKKGTPPPKNFSLEIQTQIVPHKTLFVEELPKITTEQQIQIFQQYPGFKYQPIFFSPLKTKKRGQVFCPNESGFCRI